MPLASSLHILESSLSWKSATQANPKHLQNLEQGNYKIQGKIDYNIDF